MEAPKGFSKDPASGLFYSEISVYDEKTGEKIRRVIWFYPKTGNFQQVDYPVEECTENKMVQNQMLSQGASNTAYTLTKAVVPDKKGQWAVVLGLAAFFLIVITILGVLGAELTMTRSVIQKNSIETATEEVVVEDAEIAVDWEQTRATIEQVEAVEGIRSKVIRIRVEGIDLPSIENQKGIYQSFLFLGDYALRWFYMESDREWNMCVFEVTNEEPANWELQGNSSSMSVEQDVFVLEFEAGGLALPNVEELKVLPINIYFSISDPPQIVGEVKVKSVETVAPSGDQSPLEGTYAQYDKVDEGVNGLIRFKKDGTFFAEVEGPEQYTSGTGTYTRVDEQVLLTCESGTLPIKEILLIIDTSKDELQLERPRAIGTIFATRPLIKVPESASVKQKDAPIRAGNEGNNHTGNNQAGNSGAPANNAFPYAGTFTCWDPGIPDEYRPSITFNSDMSFSMTINTGEGMAYTSGRMTWDSSDSHVYFQFNGSAGEPAEAYGYFYDANMFVFMGEGFGILGYGDNYGVMSR